MPEESPTKAVIIGLAAGIGFILAISIVVNVAFSKPVSDLKLQQRMEQTREVKAFLSKYPDANVGFNADDKIRTIAFLVTTTRDSDGDGSGDEAHVLKIDIVADRISGEVFEMVMYCGSEKETKFTFQPDIIQELERENCLLLPSEEELIEKSKALVDVKNFLADYPDAQVEVSRKSMAEAGLVDEFTTEGHVAVIDYGFKKVYDGEEDKFGNAVYNEARLSVVMDARGYSVFDIFVYCDTGFAGGPGIVSPGDDTPPVQFLKVFNCAMER